jgi:hypothetical protein
MWFGHESSEAWELVLFMIGKQGIAQMYCYAMLEGHGHPSLWISRTWVFDAICSQFVLGTNLWLLLFLEQPEQIVDIPANKQTFELFVGKGWGEDVVEDVKLEWLSRLKASPDVV